MSTNSFATLIDEQIPRRIRDLASTTISLDVISYGTIGGDRALEMLKWFPKSRLILGHFFDEDYERARLFARAIPLAWNCEARLLQNSHAKLLIFHGQHPRVIVGSYNLGSSAQHETAILVDGYPAMAFRRAYDTYWKRSTKVNKVNLAKIKASLVGAEFEVPR